MQSPTFQSFTWYLHYSSKQGESCPLPTGELPMITASVFTTLGKPMVRSPVRDTTEHQETLQESGYWN